MSMAHGVEARQPFLDVRVVEYGMRLRGDQKVARGVTKRPLQDLAVTLGLGDRSRNKKLGFPTPLAQWLAQLAPQAVTLLPGGALTEAGLIGPDALSRVMQAKNPGDSGRLLMFRLITAELFLRQTFDGDS